MEEQKYNIEYKEEYFSDIQKHKKSGDKNTLKKIGSFLLEIENIPTIGIGFLLTDIMMINNFYLLLHINISSYINILI